MLHHILQYGKQPNRSDSKQKKSLPEGRDRMGLAYLTTFFPLTTYTPFGSCRSEVPTYWPLRV